jgi:hypothetical protein
MNSKLPVLLAEFKHYEIQFSIVFISAVFYFWQ